MATSEKVFIAMCSEGVALEAQRYLGKNTSHEVVGRASDFDMALHAVASARELGISALVVGTDWGVGAHEKGQHLASTFKYRARTGLVVPFSFSPGEKILFGDVPPVYVNGESEAMERMAHAITVFTRPPRP